MFSSRILLFLPAFLLAGHMARALTVPQSVVPPRPPRRPLVIWHGLGDSYNSPSMQGFIEVGQMHPGIFIHSVYIAPEQRDDEKATWFGYVVDQVEAAAAQISAVPELSAGFDAIGFSQAGQFLRAYVEWYNSPPVHNLITFGAQHLGVNDIPGCKPRDFFCKMASNAAKAGVYSTWAQHNLVQAQYYRDVDRLETYLQQSTFLPRLNNEIDSLRNESYAENLRSLKNLVLVQFAQEQTVVPPESSWFGSFAPREGKEERVVVPMRQQPLYVEDWIGLRSLDESDRLHLFTCDGQHMQINRDCLEQTVGKYIGGFVQTSVAEPALVVQAR